MKDVTQVIEPCTAYEYKSTVPMNKACQWLYNIKIRSLLILARVHNIIEEESILLSITLYKRVLQSISAFHRLLP